MSALHAGTAGSQHRLLWDAVAWAVAAEAAAVLTGRYRLDQP